MQSCKTSGMAVKGNNDGALALAQIILRSFMNQRLYPIRS